jgi:hypothetical protein
MTAKSRATLLVASIVVLVAAFVLLRPSDDKPDTATQTSEQTTPATTETPTAAATEDGASTPTPTPTPTPRPTVDPGPLLTSAKVTKIRVDKGDTVRFRARSSKGDEIHVHGYDLSKEVPPGKTVAMSFKANIDGIFEIEFENSGVEIAQLRVDP